MKNKANLIIFDVGGTLIDTSIFRAFFYIGIFKVFIYATKYFLQIKEINFEKLENNLEEFFLKILFQIPSPYTTGDKLKPINKDLMSPIERDFFLGKINSKQCIEIGDRWVQENKQIFESKINRDLFLKIYHLNFNPKIFIKYQKQTKLINLLKTCYLKKNNCVVLLSNMSLETIDLLKQKFPDIFKFSHKQIFSSESKHVKPSDYLYNQCIEACKNQEDLKIYIDNENYQREMGRNFGFISVEPSKARELLMDLRVI